MRNSNHSAAYQLVVGLGMGAFAWLAFTKNRDAYSRWQASKWGRRLPPSRIARWSPFVVLVGFEVEATWIVLNALWRMFL